jgi:hypothetical protein
VLAEILNEWEAYIAAGESPLARVLTLLALGSDVATRDGSGACREAAKPDYGSRRTLPSTAALMGSTRESARACTRTQWRKGMGITCTWWL